MRKLAAALALVFTLILPLTALAALTPAGSGLSTTGNAAYGPPATLDISFYVGAYIVKPVIGLTGLIFFILMIYAGFLWMTARGDSKQLDKAKSVLTAGIIGAVIIASAYVITNTVISNLTGTAPTSTTIAPTTQ